MIISVAVAQQDAIPATPSSPNNTFYLFTAEHDGINTTKTGIEPLYMTTYSLQVAIAEAAKTIHGIRSVEVTDLTA